jgi:hypothetical protein
LLRALVPLAQVSVPRDTGGKRPNKLNAVKVWVDVFVTIFFKKVFFTSHSGEQKEKCNKEKHTFQWVID